MMLLMGLFVLGFVDWMVDPLENHEPLKVPGFEGDKSSLERNEC